MLQTMRAAGKLRDYPGMDATSLDSLDDPHRQLGRFLRARREALPPASGAPGPVRRRTPGWRREEVASHAGISTTWYTWLEQGRDIALSGAALARLAQVLQLAPAERAYLFELARRRDPAAAVAAPTAPPALQRMVEAMPMPAYLLDRAWRRCAWSPAAAELFAPWAASGEPCLLRYVFFDPGARNFIDDWEARANRLVDEFRADTALYPDDAGLVALLAELRAASPVFAAGWERYGVLAREGGSRRFHHPKWGCVQYEQATLLPVAGAGHKLVLLMLGGDAAPGGR